MSSPILISLDMIAVHNPCKAGWEKILAARGGVSADRDALFPLTDALDSNGIDDTLWALRCIDGHERMKRRFAAWCARQVMHLNGDPRVLAAIVAAEDFADGLIGAAASARADAYAASDAAYAARAAASASDAAYAASAAQADKLREILTAGEWV